VLLLVIDMIQIDTREPTDEIMNIIASNVDLLKRASEFELRKLNLGDYLIERKNGSTLLVERKTVADYCNSVYKSSGNGSLSSKLMRMRAVADEAILLIEGSYKRSNDTKVHTYAGRFGLPYAVFKKYQLHRQQDGCRLLTTNDLEETIHLLLVLQDDLGGSPALKAKSWEQFMILLPNIGKKKFEKVKNKYNSPAEAFQHMDEWLVGLPLDRW